MRRTLDLSAALAAIALAAVGAASFFAVPTAVISVSPRTSVVLLCYEGRARAFWIESYVGPVEIEVSDSGTVLHIVSRAAAWPPLPPGLVGVDVPRDRDWRRYITIAGRRQVPAFGGSWRSTFGAPAFQPPPARMTYIRFPTWLPCLLLLYPPVRAIARGMRERYRRRHNLCLNCGYHLKGLPEPRCPECGNPIQ